MDQSQSSPYVLKRHSESQLEAIRTLYRESFGISTTVQELEAKFATKIFGAEYTGVVAYAENGEPAAYYGVFPVRIRLEGKQLLAAQSGDTMTAPNHRMKGLFVKTAAQAYEIARTEGVNFVFGFPNENSYPGFKSKLNWEFHGFMYNFRLSAGGMPLAAFGKRFRRFSRPIQRIIACRLAKHAHPLTAEIALRFSDSIQNGLVRDLAYLNYKRWNGSKLVSFGGFTFFVKVDGELVIGDAVYFEMAQVSNFLASVRKLSQHLFCHKVLFSLSRNHWLYGYLESAGLQPQESLPIGFLNLSPVSYPFESIAFSRLDYDTF